VVLPVAGGQNAWHVAAREGHTDVLRAMAHAVQSLPPEKFAKFSKFGTTPQKVLTKLVQEEDSKNLTPLHLAAIKGHAEAAALLMDYGTNPFTMVS
jgi:ankyrin repeat protein